MWIEETSFPFQNTHLSNKLFEYWGKKSIVILTHYLYTWTSSCDAFGMLPRLEAAISFRVCWSAWLVLLLILLLRIRHHHLLRLRTGHAGTILTFRRRKVSGLPHLAIDCEKGLSVLHCCHHSLTYRTLVGKTHSVGFYISFSWAWINSCYEKLTKSISMIQK